MTLLQGQSCLYRCGCTLPPDGPFHVVYANGNEVPPEKLDMYVAAYRKTRETLLGKTEADKLTVAAMVVEIDPAPKDEKGDPLVLPKDVVAYKPLPARCAVHGQPAVSTHAWCYDSDSLPKEPIVEEVVVTP